MSASIAVNFVQQFNSQIRQGYVKYMYMIKYLFYFTYSLNCITNRANEKSAKKLL